MAVTRRKQQPLFKIIATTVIVLAALYLVTVIFLVEQTFLGVATILVLGIAFYVYLSPNAHAYRYLFPGLVGMAIFVAFPLIYTIWLGSTNYSSFHLLSYDRAEQYFLDEVYRGEGDTYSFELYADRSSYRLVLVGSGGGDRVVTPPLDLDADESRVVDAKPLNEIEFKAVAPLAFRNVIEKRHSLKPLILRLDDGSEIRMASLRTFEPIYARYHRNADKTLTDTLSGQALTPNFDTGFYENQAGQAVSPGFRVNIGLANFIRVFVDPDFQGPFLRIFVWTIVFAGLTVLFTFVVGAVLAVLLNWEALRFRKVYRTLLFLPYAVPAFISILVFKGLFNNNFGEINLILDALFGVKPLWFSDPVLSKVMLLLVNTWLGYPYMMVLCMGLLKSIPRDLYEASAISGAGPLQNLINITAPLIAKPMTMILIASFAFNFNNFVLIALLTRGRPDFLDSKVPAGTTDILVSYTYRIAFEESGKDFGLAGAIATMIFVVVAILALIQVKYAKVHVAQA